MNAKQLIRAAELLHERDKSARGMFREPGREAAKGFDGHLADHILATVCKDDDEAFTPEWAFEVGKNQIGEIAKECDGFEMLERFRIKTRGDFRALCRLLGVTLNQAKEQA